jgi:hypothetical protein
MTPQDLQETLMAPELVVVDLVEHTLRALRLALLAEHPHIDDPAADPNDARVQRRAHVMMRCAARLHRALADYRNEVRRVLHLPDDPDFPF